MIRLPLERIEPGMRNARTLRYDFGGAMVHRGALVEPRIVERLRARGITTLHVYDEQTEDVQCLELISEPVRDRITRQLQEMFGGLRAEFARLRKEVASSDGALTAEQATALVEGDKMRAFTDRIHLKEAVTPVIETLLTPLMAEADLARWVRVLPDATEYLYDHSIDVTVLSAILGRRFGLGRADLIELATGALLHDIGYLFLPDALTQKVGKLAKPEEREIQAHTTLGYHFLKEVRGIPLISAHIAYQHHECADGSGFPRQLVGEAASPAERTPDTPPGVILRFADIVAVPNAYCATEEDRPYRAAVGPEAAHKRVESGSGSKFNPAVADAFLNLIPRYPVASTVLVGSGDHAGWTGVISKVPPGDRHRPVVRLLRDASGQRLGAPVELDLTRTRVRLKIVTE